MHEHVIETRGLSRRFKAKLAVEDLNLQVPEAGVYGFLGPNGAGKTTTIRMLLGLIRPDAGEVHLFGTPLAGSHEKLMRRVGALVETPSLYPHLTGRENLEVTRRLIGASREKIDRALEITKLSRDSNRLVREYSLGMRHRLGLGLALMNQPELLILDEPTNGLDPAGIHEMRELIRRLPAESGVTVFLSSHLLNEVEQIAGRIGIIHEGRLLFQGSLQDLQAERQPQLILGVKQPDRAVHCLAAAGWSAQRRGDGLLTVADATREAAAAINGLLLGQGIEVFHLEVTQASLEDIFLTVTREKAAAKAGAA